MAKSVIDPDHSVAAFVITHMMVANVREQFKLSLYSVRSLPGLIFGKYDLIAYCNINQPF